MTRSGARGVGFGRTQAGAPPTHKQTRLIEKLCRELGSKPPRSLVTKEDASAYIDQLKAQKPRKKSPASSSAKATKKPARTGKVSVLNPKTQRYEMVSAEEAARRRRSSAGPK